MKILYAAPENARGGFLGMIRSKIPQQRFEASGRFGVDSLYGFKSLTVGIRTARFDYRSLS